MKKETSKSKGSSLKPQHLFSFWIEEELYHKVKRRAAREMRTTSGWIRWLIAKELSKR